MEKTESGVDGSWVQLGMELEPEVRPNQVHLKAPAWSVAQRMASQRVALKPRAKLLL